MIIVYEKTDWFLEARRSLLRAGELQRFDKCTVQTLGFALIVSGILPLFFGLHGSSTSRSANGCPPDVISRLYWQIAIPSFLASLSSLLESFC